MKNRANGIVERDRTSAATSEHGEVTLGETAMPPFLVQDNAQHLTHWEAFGLGKAGFENGFGKPGELFVGEIVNDTPDRGHPVVPEHKRLVE